MAFAASIGATPAHVAGLPTVRDELREVVAGIGVRTLSEHLDPVVLSRLMHAELRSRVHIRTCYNLLNALLWYYAADAPSTTAPETAVVQPA